MSLFAVLEPHDGGIEVKRLDLTVACLPALFGRRNFVCDIGLAFTAVERPLSEIEICVPFGFRDNDIEDLGPRLLNPVTASLVFGSKCEVQDTDAAGAIPAASSRTSRLIQSARRARVRHQKGTSHVLRKLVFSDRDLVAGKPRQQEYILNYMDGVISRRDAGASFRRLTVGLSNVVLPGTTSYLRFRVHVLSLGRAWQWTRFMPFGIPSSSTLDMRISDVREAASAGVQLLADRMAAIEQAHLLVATGQDYRWVRTSPNPTSVRVLEASHWLEYLGRRISLIGQGKLVVNLWSQSDVSETRPVRVYASVKRETRLTRLMELARMALIGILVLMLVFDHRYWSDGALADIWDAVVAVYEWLPGGWILPGSLFAIFSAASLLSKNVNVIRSTLYRADRWVYNIGRR